MTIKSCADCPSRIPANEVAIRFGKDIGAGASACLRYGHVFGKAGSDEAAQRKIGNQYAKACGSFGDPKPTDATAVEHLEARVAGPSAAMLRESMAVTSSPTHEAPSSCADCEYLVPESTTYRQFGWSSPLCGATGRLIFPSRFRKEAKACDLGVLGAVDFNMIDGIELLPVYDDDFGYGQVGDWAEENIDPTDYPTDQPVSDADRALGIRAWRVYEDPSGYGKPVHLPIFDPDSFDIVEQAKIPRTGDESHCELYQDHQGLGYKLAVDWSGLDEVPSLGGDAGTGKTELIRKMAWEMVMPFDRINFNKSTEADQILGTWLFANNETVWKNGRIPQGWLARRVTCVDEPNRADTVIQEVFLPLTDNSKQLILESAGIPFDDPETGERKWLTPPALARNEFSYWAFCMNPAWDPKYHGTIELDQALVSRLCHYSMEYPPEEVERDILIRRYALDEDKAPPKKTLDTIMKIAAELRALIEAGTLPISWGVREQIKVVRATPYFRLPEAYKRAVADYLEPQTRSVILDVVEANTHA